MFAYVPSTDSSTADICMSAVQSICLPIIVYLMSFQGVQQGEGAVNQTEREYN